MRNRFLLFFYYLLSTSKTFLLISYKRNQKHFNYYFDQRKFWLMIDSNLHLFFKFEEELVIFTRILRNIFHFLIFLDLDSAFIYFLLSVLSINRFMFLNVIIGFISLFPLCFGIIIILPSFERFMDWLDFNSMKKDFDMLSLVDNNDLREKVSLVFVNCMEYTEYYAQFEPSKSFFFS